MNNMFALVSDGTIKKLNLRRGTIKGLGKLSPDSTYISKGYYPIIGEKPVVSLETHKISGPRYELGDNVVQKVWVVEERTADEIELDALKVKLKEDKKKEKSPDPVEVTVDEGTFTFKGGAGSASFIFSAISLAQALEEPTVFLTDSNDELVELSYASALECAKAVGVAYRTLYFSLKDTIVKIKNKKE